MHVLLTGASGQAGGFILPALGAAGHEVTVLGRRPGPPGTGWHPWDLADPAPGLPAADALVHAAFSHVPGAYRGGEGDDPAGFLRRNRDGSLALFAAAGSMRIVFLSTRAVYGDARRGEILRETDRARPDSLYGEMKLACEAALGPDAVALRATGIYGGPDHKWRGLFADYLAGRPVAPRAGTEVHGDDLAAAVVLALHQGSGSLNVSDLMVDRHDLLAGVARRTGCPHPPPAPAPAPLPGVMETRRLTALGWRPGGRPRLEAFLDAACRTPD